MTKKLWKTMLDGMRSQSGSLEPWVVGTWRKHKGKLELCHSGFHASPNVIDALGYVSPGVVCEVEVRGKHKAHSDKECWSEMRVLRAWAWSKEDSVALAIYAAELVIGIYEDRYPHDKRPRRAIDAAKAWLKHPSEKTRAAAGAAADAADAAAADAAEADAADAAWAAGAAAGAAADAAEAAVTSKCHEFVVDRLEARGAK